MNGSDLAGERNFLNIFSKVVVFSTLFLIFVGGLVTSTGSGLAVPDWPLSYGTLFPPMVGGIFYEHGHRMAASTVGFFLLILIVVLARREKRRWVRRLGYCALGAVIFQGLLGGITVKFYLPMAISVFHGIFAQTFFLMTIFLAYSESVERKRRELENNLLVNSKFIKLSAALLAIVYLQLLIAALMRHTHSGLAIPDFPTAGGFWVPPFNDTMLARINSVRFDADLKDVQLWQVGLHYTHRVIALIIVLFLSIINFKIFSAPVHPRIRQSILLLNGLVVLQVILGIMTILTWKEYHITSLHVATGAATLGMSFLFLLRLSPLSFNQFRNFVKPK